MDGGVRSFLRDACSAVHPMAATSPLRTLQSRIHVDTRARTSGSAVLETRSELDRSHAADCPLELN